MQRPDRSVLNSVVSLGRMGLPIFFISEYGKDDVGNLIDDFLKNNGVNSSFVHRYQNGSTALALAFLNEKNDAHYSFYKDYPGKRLDIDFPVIERNDIILCGSFYAIWPEINLVLPERPMYLITGLLTRHLNSEPKWLNQNHGIII